MSDVSNQRQATFPTGGQSQGVNHHPQTHQEVPEDELLKHLDIDLKALVSKGKAQGYLTYDQINAYLPDQM